MCRDSFLWRYFLILLILLQAKESKKNIGKLENQWPLSLCSVRAAQLGVMCLLFTYQERLITTSMHVARCGHSSDEFLFFSSLHVGSFGSFHIVVCPNVDVAATERRHSNRWPVAHVHAADRLSGGAHSLARCKLCVFIRSLFIACKQWIHELTIEYINDNHLYPP